MKDMGIVDKGKKSAKPKRGVSFGGRVNKKLRSEFELAGASVRDHESGSQASMNAAKDLQQKSRGMTQKEKQNAASKEGDVEL